MNQDIHPLQHEAITLLEELLKDDRLSVTTAMLNVQKRRYPSVESILSTLNHYADQDLVKKFSERNRELIEQTQKELDEQKEKEEEARKAEGETRKNKSPNFDDDFFSLDLRTTKPYESIKSIPLTDIETAFSEELSKLCNDELTVTIDSLNPEHEPFNSRVEMKVTVKGR